MVIDAADAADATASGVSEPWCPFHLCGVESNAKCVTGDVGSRIIVSRAMSPPALPASWRSSTKMRSQLGTREVQILVHDSHDRMRNIPNRAVRSTYCSRWQRTQDDVLNIIEVDAAFKRAFMP